MAMTCVPAYSLVMATQSCGHGTRPDPNSGFVAVAAGGNHSLGLRADGSIAVWGHNYYGQLDVPAPNSGFVAVAAGWGHSLGVRTDGSIAAWGKNFRGQCDVPAPNTGFVAVAGGSTHSLGLKAADCPADLNGDGIIDTRDFITFLGA